MSAYKWLAFAFGIPLLAVIYAIMNEVTQPAIGMLNKYSSSEASAQGITWYAQFWEWLPLVLLMLLGFMVIVAVIVRRRSVVGR